MTPNADPWRTLGLAPGASQDEIRRAYRRLAKINHPDAAGDGALPRFLAIHAAYEQLAGPSARRPGARPTTRASGGVAREPWRADPDRARASGRADGRRPGARPTGTAEGRGTAASGGSPGGGSRGPGPGSAGTGGPSTARGGSAPRAGRPDADAGARSGTDGAGNVPGGPAGAGRTRRPSSRRRAANKATPYSTSYDKSDDEPFEPDWTGGTWYGASSGTYWTINPKEYADPRKHGPEYQARARRSRNASDLGDLDAADDAATSAGGDDTGRAGTGDHARAADRRTADDAPPASPDGRRARRAASAPGSRSTRRDQWAARETEPASVGQDGVAGATRPWRADGIPAGNPAGADAGRPPGDRPPDGPAFRPASWIDPRPGSSRFAGPLLRQPSTLAGRLAMALLAWPPLGAIAATAIGESTGCGRFAASCAEASSPGTWIVQAAIIVLLVALPRIAAWSAHGSLAALVVGVPSAIVLSAGGGARQPDASASVLLGLLAIAYIVGVGYAVIVPLLPARRDAHDRPTGGEPRG